MLQVVLTQLLKLLVPGAKPWVISLIVQLVPAIVELVDSIVTAKDKAGAAITGTAVLLDDAMDSIPEWSDLSEADRDTIIAGLAKLAEFISDVAERPGGKKAVKAAVRKARRG